MAKVFISYSSHDVEFVDGLVKDLSDRSVDVWYAKTEIKVGDSIVQKLNSGLGNSDWLLLVLSKSSMASKWVELELNAAVALTVQRGAYILVARIDSVAIPAILSDRKYADFVGDRKRGLNEILAVLSPGVALYKDEESQIAWAQISVLASALLSNSELDSALLNDLLEPLKNKWAMDDDAFSLYIDCCMRQRRLLHELEFINQLKDLDRDDPRMGTVLRYLLGNMKRGL